MIFRYYEIVLRCSSQRDCAIASGVVQGLGYELESAEQDFTKNNVWKLRGGSVVDPNLTDQEMYEQVDEALRTLYTVTLLETKLFFT